MARSIVSKPNVIKYPGFSFYKDNQTQSYKVRTYEYSVAKLRKTETTHIKKLVSIDYCLLKIKTVNQMRINYW